MAERIGNETPVVARMHDDETQRIKLNPRINHNDFEQTQQQDVLRIIIIISHLHLYYY